MNNVAIVQVVNIGMNSLALGTFIYFLDIVGNLGKALFKLIQFNIDGKKND